MPRYLRSTNELTRSAAEQLIQAAQESADSVYSYAPNGGSYPSDAYTTEAALNAALASSVGLVYVDFYPNGADITLATTGNDCSRQIWRTGKLDHLTARVFVPTGYFSKLPYMLDAIGVRKDTTGSAYTHTSGTSTLLMHLASLVVDLDDADCHIINKTGAGMLVIYGDFGCQIQRGENVTGTNGVIHQTNADSDIEILLGVDCDIGADALSSDAVACGINAHSTSASGSLDSTQAGYQGTYTRTSSVRGSNIPTTPGGTFASTNLDALIIEIESEMAAKQPLDAGLTSIAGLTTAANKAIYATASDTYATTDLTSGGRALIGLTAIADKIAYWTSASAAALTDLGVAARSLLSVAASAAADKVPYFTSSSAASLFTVTSAARSVLDDATVADMRTTLGVSPTTDTATTGAAVSNSSAFNNVASGAVTQLAFDTLDSPDPDNYDVDKGIGVLTVPAGKEGWHIASADTRWEANATGIRDILLRVERASNPGTYVTFGRNRAYAGTAAAVVKVSCTKPVYLYVGDEVSLWVQQTSGSAIDVELETGDGVGIGTPGLSLVRM